jgi:hypothetical protein
VTRHLFFLPFIVNEDIRDVIVKTLISIKLKGDKAPNLNILFILQNLQGTFAESTRHHWKLYLVQVYSFYRIYKAPLQNLQGTTGNCALYKAFTIHPFFIISLRGGSISARQLHLSLVDKIYLKVWDINICCITVYNQDNTYVNPYDATCTWNLFISFLTKHIQTVPAKNPLLNQNFYVANPICFDRFWFPNLVAEFGKALLGIPLLDYLEW